MHIEFFLNTNVEPFRRFLFLRGKAYLMKNRNVSWDVTVFASTSRAFTLRTRFFSHEKRSYSIPLSRPGNRLSRLRVGSRRGPRGPRRHPHPSRKHVTPSLHLLVCRTGLSGPDVRTEVAGECNWRWRMSQFESY